jgi:ABC-type cobalamin/Fe3+-siderophores transport system ATPase subunit
LFENGETADALVERLGACGWWGQIVGPHGSGKSTLLASLLPQIEAAGRSVLLLELHQGERRLPRVDWSRMSDRTMLVVDGYEQLGWWSRLWLKSHCRRSRCGLLITAHADMGLPMLFRPKPSEELARRIVAQLIPTDNPPVSNADVASAFAKAQGNLRETLFTLFDVYQAQRD